MTSGLVVGLCLLALPPNEAAPPITALAFTPDGRAVVVGSQAGIEMRAWPSLARMRRLPTELVHVHDLAFAPDGKILAAVGGTPAKTGTVELYRWPNGELVQRTSPHRDLIYAVGWRADSAVFATASADRSVGLHEAATAKTLRTLEGHSRGVLAVCFLPGEAGLLTAGLDESLRLWHTERGEALRTLQNHTGPVYDLALRPSVQIGVPMVASVGDDRTLRLWQPTLGRLVRFVRLDSPARAVAWTDDGAAVLAACKDGRVRAIDAETVQVRTTEPALEGVAHSLRVAPDGSVLVGGQNGQLKQVTLRPALGVR